MKGETYLLWQVLQTPEPMLPPTLLRNTPSAVFRPLKLLFESLVYSG